MTAMKNPPHPGRIMKMDCMEPLGLTVTDAAAGLGVAWQALNSLIHGRSRISPEMAIRLSKGFGGSAESWLRQQMLYDLWQVKKKEKSIRVKAFAEARTR